MYEVKLCLERNLVDPQSFREASDLALALSNREHHEYKAEREQKVGLLNIGSYSLRLNKIKDLRAFV